ncbi:MAG: ribonuclease R [Flavobacteriales bacterium]
MSQKTDKKLKKGLKRRIVKLILESPSKHYTSSQIAKALRFNQPMKKKLIEKLLKEMVQDSRLTIQDDRYHISVDFDTTEGEIEFTAKGSAYILIEGKDDIYIPRGKTLNALNGDTVEYSIIKVKKQGKVEGKVEKVIKRKRTEFVGTLDVSQKFAFVISDNKKIHIDFFIDLKHLKKAKNGDKVIVELINWPARLNSPFGRIKKILGKSGDTDTEINAIMEDFELPYQFPQEVLQAAEDVDTTISKKEIAKRRDFRNIDTLTIDPFDAKDFDDAISYRELENGNIEVGVHIADVSHYVVPGTIIDDEAIHRGTSVYLVDRVVPMLPEVLSNQVCSLRPNEEKLTFSAVFELDKEANLKNKWFGRTVINSNRRFTYEEAQERIENKEGDYQKEINTLNDLAQIMRAKRMGNGALNIETTEVKFIVENGKPVGVKLKTSKEAHKLVEEFMLLANKHVSRFIGIPKKGEARYPNIYRIHDKPSDEKIADLHRFVTDNGYEIKEVKDKPLSFALNNLLTEAKENREIEFIGPMVIRSMAKAVYSAENIGHYGLSFDYYSHFTSPIRRYPDLMLHRILQNFLDKKKPQLNEDEIEQQSKYFSNQEKKATDAERASIKFMQVVFMKDKVGEEFTGTISGVTSYGIFVEINENKCEGLIRTNAITQDRFYFEENGKKLVGKNYGDELKMGSKVTVEITKVDMINRTIDMELVDYERS